MRVTREEAARNRTRIVEAAARRFRERGFHGIGVVDLMREVGLTHGGFYGHFGSKEDLMAEAVTRSLGRSLERWRKRAQAEPGDPLGALARMYLSARHRDAPGEGCVIAALAAEGARQGHGVRHAFTEGLRASFAALAGWVGGTPSARRRRAIATYAAWVGALVLARAAADDAALSREILAAVASETAGDRAR